VFGLLGLTQPTSELACVFLCALRVCFAGLFVCLVFSGGSQTWKAASGFGVLGIGVGGLWDKLVRGLYCWSIWVLPRSGFFVWHWEAIQRIVCEPSTRWDTVFLKDNINPWGWADKLIET
jgi:hypothetical protein